MYYFYNGIGEYYLYCIQVCFREIRSATSVLGCPACTPTEAVTVRPSTTHASSSSAATQPGPQMDRSIRVPDCSLLACMRLLPCLISSSVSASHRSRCPIVHICYRHPFFFFSPKTRKKLKRKLWRTSRVKYVHSRTHVLMSEISGVVMG